MVTIKLSKYQARVIYMQLCALLEAGADTLDKKELEALELVTSKLRGDA